MCGATTRSWLHGRVRSTSTQGCGHRTEPPHLRPAALRPRLLSAARDADAAYLRPSVQRAEPSLRLSCSTSAFVPAVSTSPRTATMMLSVAMSGTTVARPAVSGRTAAIAKPTLRSRSVVVRSADDDKKGESGHCGRTRTRACVVRDCDCLCDCLCARCAAAAIASPGPEILGAEISEVRPSELPKAESSNNLEGVEGQPFVGSALRGIPPPPTPHAMPRSADYPPSRRERVVNGPGGQCLTSLSAFKHCFSNSLNLI
eukprot:366104-Chlamydomonas_euryale.AAC.19